MGTTFTVTPIGHVHSGETPEREDFWGGIESTITLEPPFTAESLRGLDEFSHILVIYLFDQVSPDSVVNDVRHPRGNENWPKVGIFAQRAKRRPNRLAVSVCELLRINGTTLHVRGLDAANNSPVLDIKPHMLEFVPEASKVRQAEWAKELMADYFKNERG